MSTVGPSKASHDILSGVPFGRDFALLAIHGPQVDIESPTPMCLGDGMSVFFGIGQPLPNHWVRELGTLQAGKCSASELVFRYVPEKPESFEGMYDKLRAIFYGLLLQGMPDITAALLLAATSVDPEMRVLGTAPMLPHYRMEKQYPARIGPENLRTAFHIARGLQSIHDGRNRLRRGFQAWLSGVLSSDGLSSLHQFVRAIDAAVLPRMRRNTLDFLQRGQFFIGRSVSSQKRLEEMRNLRDADEHLNDVTSELNDYPEVDAVTVLSMRVFQAGEIAAYVLRTILSSPVLTACFRREDSIEAFWSQREDDREATWGADPLDLTARTQDGFAINQLSLETQRIEQLVRSSNGRR